MQWSDLVANQLHDLKNQLGVLMQQIDSTQAEERILLQKSSRLIHDDLNSLLILFRMDENKFKLDRMDLPLCDVPEEAAARHEPLLRSSDIDLQLECDPDAYGFYDRPLLVSVLAHGVLNAINAQAKTIHLQAKLEGQGCCFSVDDDGVGLNAPIEQSERIPGAGVGILLGKEVAAAHKRGEQQGELTLQPSEALGGTQLRLWIPQ